MSFWLLVSRGRGHWPVGMGPAGGGGGGAGGRSSFTARTLRRLVWPPGCRRSDTRLRHDATQLIEWSSKHVPRSMRPSGAQAHECALSLPAAAHEGGHDEGPGRCHARSACGPGRRRGMGCNPEVPVTFAGCRRRGSDVAVGHRVTVAVLGCTDARRNGEQRPDIAGHRPRRDLDHARGRHEAHVLRRRPCRRGRRAPETG